MKRIEETIDRMLLCIGKIEKFKVGLGKDTFILEEEKTGAIEFELVVLGDLTNRLTDEFKAKTNYIKWADIKGLRNRLVHDYDGINFDDLWNTINEDIPKLKNDLLCIQMDLSKNKSE